MHRACHSLRRAEKCALRHVRSRPAGETDVLRHQLPKPSTSLTKKSHTVHWIGVVFISTKKSRGFASALRASHSVSGARQHGHPGFPLFLRPPGARSHSLDRMGHPCPHPASSHRHTTKPLCSVSARVLSRSVCPGEVHRRISTSRANYCPKSIALQRSVARPAGVKCLPWPYVRNH